MAGGSAVAWNLAGVLATRVPPLPRDTDDGVDVTLIRWMRSLSPEQRLAVLQGFPDSVAELTHDSQTTEGPHDAAPLPDGRVLVIGG
jgi:hypothetical protein